MIGPAYGGLGPRYCDGSALTVQEHPAPAGQAADPAALFQDAAQGIVQRDLSRCPGLGPRAVHNPGPLVNVGPS